MVRSVGVIVGVLTAVILGLGPAAGETKKAPCGAPETLTFEDWPSWTKATPKPILSPGHGGIWVGIYLNDLARDVYLAAGAPHPTCAAIVKAIYGVADGSEVLRLSVMVKMPAGYHSDRADWWYGTYDAEGRKAKRQGKLQDCFLCHAFAEETDYLFAEEVLRAIGK